MSDNDLSGRRLGGYRLLRRLGQGGMATVYKAHEESLNRVVALKVIARHLSDKPEFIERFKREARSAARLSHPHIVQIYAIDEDQGLHFFSMEYVKGKSLRELIETEGFLTARRAVPLIIQTTEALAAAHEAGVVHRDIKPANIMLDGAERTKVADFGIAQLATETQLTKAGMFVGTPEYVSPEQCRGEKLDGRTDIYSLGVTFFQMLSGRTPYEADTPTALILQIIEGQMREIGELNPTIPTTVQAVLKQMLATNRDDRPRAQDLLVTLAQLDYQSEPTRRVAGGPPPRPAPPLPETLPLDAQTGHRGAPPPAGPTVEVTGGATRPPASPAVSARADRPADGSAAAAPSPSPAGRLRPDARARSRVPLRAVAVAAGLIVAAVLAFSWPSRPGADADSRSVDAGDAAPDSLADPDPIEERPEIALAASPDLERVEPMAELPSSPEARPPTAIDPTPPPTDREPPNRVPPVSPPPVSPVSPPGPAAVIGEAATVPAVSTPDLQRVAGAPTEAFAPPPPDSVLVETSGDYEYVDLINVWVEQELVRRRLSVMAIPSASGAPLQETARFQVVTTVTVVDATNLEFFGQVETQYTVALTMRGTDLMTGATAAGPVQAVVKHTALNMEQQLGPATRQLVRRIAADLR